MGEEHHEHRRNHNTGSFTALIVCVVIFLIMLSITPIGKQIVGIVESGATLQPTVAAKTPQLSSDSDQCLSTGGVWRQDGDQPGYCMWPAK